MNPVAHLDLTGGPDLRPANPRQGRSGGQISTPPRLTSAHRAQLERRRKNRGAALALLLTAALLFAAAAYGLHRTDSYCRSNPSVASTLPKCDGVPGVPHNQGATP